MVRLSATARILIAGQAPGLRVHESGVPFDDRSGDRLRDWMGIGRDVFYDAARVAILPMGLCFPGYDAAGGDLPPRRECAPRWRAQALALLPRIELILLIGGYAQHWHLKRRRPVGEAVRDWRAVMAATDPPALALPHPSWRNTGWLKQNPWFEAEVLPVLRGQVARLIGPE